MEPGYYRDPDWTVRDVVAHVGTWLAQAEVQLERMVGGTYEGHQGLDIDAINALMLEAVHDRYGAWTDVIEDDTLPNIVGRAIIGGIVAPGQAELLQPFTSRYFEDIPGVWDRRSSEVAQTVVIGLYPSWDISEDAVAKADRFLGGDLPPALRRLVIEGKAGVERALKARRFDAHS